VTEAPISGLPSTRGTPEDVQSGIGDGWTPRELRTSFVSVMSHNGVSIEEIAHLVGHASTGTAEVVYRRELRPVITTGAEIMGEVFGLGRLDLCISPEPLMSRMVCGPAWI
jgi:hypothetical protein